MPPSSPPPAAPSSDALEAAFRLLCSEIMRARAAWPGAAPGTVRLDAAFLDLTHHASQALAAMDDPEQLEEVQRVLVHEAFLSAINLYALTLALLDDAALAGAPRGALAAVRTATIDLVEAYRPLLTPPDEALRAVLLDGVPVREVMSRAAPR